MLPYLLGSILILGGLGWGLLALFAAGMADRQTTWVESVGTPLTGLIPIILGIIIIIWG